MSPETIEALNDCEKASKEILKPLSLIGHAINKNGYLNKTFRKNQKALTEYAERFVLLLSREPEIKKIFSITENLKAGISKNSELGELDYFPLRKEFDSVIESNFNSQIYYTFLVMFQKEALNRFNRIKDWSTEAKLFASHIKNGNLKPKDTVLFAKYDPFIQENLIASCVAFALAFKFYDPATKRVTLKRAFLKFDPRLKCMLDTVYYVVRTPHKDTSSFRYNIYSPVSVVCKTIKAFSEVPDFAIEYGIT